jgi:hypothetical protein
MHEFTTFQKCWMYLKNNNNNNIMPPILPKAGRLSRMSDKFPDILVSFKYNDLMDDRSSWDGSDPEISDNPFKSRFSNFDN